MAGGRPQVQEARHFKPLNDLGRAGGGYGYRECRFCRAAFDSDDSTTPPKPIIGRPRNYLSHLARCAHYQAAQLPAASPCSLPGLATPTSTRASRPVLSYATPTSTPQYVAPRTRSQSATCPPAHSSRTNTSRARRALVLVKRPSPNPKRYNQPLPKKLKPTKRKFSTTEIKQIECFLIELHADNHLADRFIEQDSTRRFLELVCPGITDILPSRRTLGDRVLKEHADRCRKMDTESLKSLETMTEGWVNLLSDVWQNISKDHLLGCHFHCLEFCSRTHYYLLVMSITESQLPNNLKKYWCKCNMRSGVLEQSSLIMRGNVAIRWPQIMFLFCFAHDVNSLVKSVLRSSFHDVATRAATAVKTLNASSSKWLPRARKMMKKFYGKALGLRTLCETRWNSMQGCFASLLRVQSALQMFYRQYKGNSDFPTALEHFGDPLFWEDLKEAEGVISPLAYASYRLQRDENTVGDVVISFRNIHRGFQQHLVRHDKLVDCIEARWAHCEQPLFMLGVALHPVYTETARELPDTAVSGIGTLANIAVYYYRRLFNMEDTGQIRRDMVRWMKGRLTRAKPSEFLGSIWEYWENIALQKPKSQLPKLALRVLSIAVNTATCERLFSDLGLIHTAKRNRMAAIKALDFHIVAKHVRERARKADAGSRNSKKKLLISPSEREIILDEQEAQAYLLRHRSSEVQSMLTKTATTMTLGIMWKALQPFRSGMNFSTRYSRMKTLAMVSWQPKAVRQELK